MAKQHTNWNNNTYWIKTPNRLTYEAGFQAFINWVLPFCYAFELQQNGDELEAKYRRIHSATNSRNVDDAIYGIEPLYDGNWSFMWASNAFILTDSGWKGEAVVRQCVILPVDGGTIMQRRQPACPISEMIFFLSELQHTWATALFSVHYMPHGGNRIVV